MSVCDNSRYECVSLLQFLIYNRFNIREQFFFIRWESAAALHYVSHVIDCINIR